MTDKEITDYIFLEDSGVGGDIGFVFGTSNSWRESVAKAVEVYKNGLVPKLIFSGGLNRDYGMIEGDIMADEALRLGVPRKDILIENKSTNTLENVLFSLKLMDQKIGLENIKSITAVVKQSHSRRALMTLRKHVAPHVQLNAAPYASAHYSFTKDDWNKSEAGRQKIKEEIEKIKNYLAKGHLAEL